MASVFKRGGKRAKGPYYASWNDQNGKRRTKCTKTTDKATAERIARKHEADAALRRDGVIDASGDRFAEQGRRPLSEHVTEFRAALTAKGDTERHCKETKAQATSVIERCQADFPRDLTASAVHAAIKELRDEARSLNTCNHYLRAIKGFSRWMYRDKRIHDDTLACLEAYNADTDPRYQRRELLPDEISWLLSITEQRTLPSHRLAGSDRAMAYRIALGTGFRATELRSLTQRSFDLDGDPPTATVEAAHSKRRRRDTQPIHAVLAGMIRVWLANKPAGSQLFAKLPLNTARMLRADLSAARSAWIAAAKTDTELSRRKESDFLAYKDADGKIVDFHATRHTYISAIVNGGASVKVAQELARHSTPTLTIGRYSHTRLHDICGALESLPDISSPEPQNESLRATGTFDSTGQGVDSAQRLAQRAAVESRRLGAIERDEGKEKTEPVDRRKSPSAQGKRETLRLDAASRERYPLGESNPCCRTENPES